MELSNGLDFIKKIFTSHVKNEVVFKKFLCIFMVILLKVKSMKIMPQY